MTPSIRRSWLSLLVVLLLLSSSPAARAGRAPLPADPAAPTMTNPNMECTAGFGPQPGIEGLVPSGWTALLLNGHPTLNSTRIHFTGSCDGSGFIERVEGIDSLAFLSQDIETPPEPGKPFDALVYQRVAVTPGTTYSLSGWMVSLCGGSAMPNDCPQGFYMSKMLGIDPAGGSDPLAPGVIWVEDLRNFTESRWVNLRLGVTAQSTNLTVFARVRSPFRWHGAHAFVDAISLVRAPLANFVSLPAVVHGTQTSVAWSGVQSPDIAAIPGGNYHLYFDVQYRRAGDSAWTDWQSGQPAGQATFSAGACITSQTFEFRLRARAEQPEGTPGASPNHRYPGAWSQPASVTFTPDAPCLPRVFVPGIWK